MSNSRNGTALSRRNGKKHLALSNVSPVKPGNAIAVGGLAPGNIMQPVAAEPKEVSTITAERIIIAKRARYNPLRNLTPALLTTQMDSFRMGYLWQAALTWDAMSRRDPIVQSVKPKREKAVSRHGYEIVKLEETPEAEQHAAALKYFYDHLKTTDALEQDDCGGFSVLVSQMMRAVGFKYQVHEIVWEPRPGAVEYTVKEGKVDTDPLTGERKKIEPKTKKMDGLTATFQAVPLWFFENITGKLRYLRQFGELYGQPMEEGGWLCTTGDGIMEATAVAYAYKHMLALKDWSAAMEAWGDTKAWGRTQQGQGTPEWEAMKQALLDIATPGGTAIVKGTEDSASLNLVESKLVSGGESVFERMIELCDRYITSLWRGGDLSTLSRAGGVGQSGQSMGASVQEPEADVLETFDAAHMSEVLNFQVDHFVIRYLFGEDAHPLAFIKITRPERKNVDQDMKVDQMLAQGGARMTIKSVADRYLRDVENPDDIFGQAAGGQPPPIGADNPLSEDQMANMDDDELMQYLASQGEAADPNAEVDPKAEEVPTGNEAKAEADEEEDHKFDEHGVAMAQTVAGEHVCSEKCGSKIVHTISHDQPWVAAHKAHRHLAGGDKKKRTSSPVHSKDYESAAVTSVIDGKRHVFAFKKDAAAASTSNEIWRALKNGEVPAEDSVEALSNAGYSDDFSKSNNAIEAENAGRYPATTLAKKLGVSPAFIRQHAPDSGEWHHTSKFYNTTPYYDHDTVKEWLDSPEGKDAHERFKAHEAEIAQSPHRVMSGANIKYLEWGGTHKHPVATEREETGVHIHQKPGGTMVTITRPNGEQFKKKLDTRGFAIQDKSGKHFYADSVFKSESVPGEPFDPAKHPRDEDGKFVFVSNESVSPEGLKQFGAAVDADVLAPLRAKYGALLERLEGALQLDDQSLREQLDDMAPDLAAMQAELPTLLSKNPTAAAVLTKLIAGAFAEGVAASNGVVSDRATCPTCGEVFDYAAQPEVNMGSVACPKCGIHLMQSVVGAGNEVGDKPGHEFHGNQYTKIAGENPDIAQHVTTMAAAHEHFTKVAAGEIAPSKETSQHLLKSRLAFKEIDANHPAKAALTELGAQIMSAGKAAGVEYMGGGKVRHWNPNDPKASAEAAIKSVPHVIDPQKPAADKPIKPAASSALPPTAKLSKATSPSQEPAGAAANFDPKHPFAPGSSDPAHGHVMEQRVKAACALYTSDTATPNAILQLHESDGDKTAKAAFIDSISHGAAAHRAQKEYSGTPRADVEILSSITVNDHPVHGQANCNLGSRAVTMGSSSVTGDFRHELGHALRAAWGGAGGPSAKTDLTKAVFALHAEAMAKASSNPAGVKQKLDHEFYETNYGVIGRRALDSVEEDFAEHYRGYHKAVYQSLNEPDKKDALEKYNQRFPGWAKLWNSWYSAQLPVKA